MINSKNTREIQKSFKNVFYSFICVEGYMVFAVFLVFKLYPYVTNILLCVIFNLEHF